MSDKQEAMLYKILFYIMVVSYWLGYFIGGGK